MSSSSSSLSIKRRTLGAIRDFFYTLALSSWTLFSVFGAGAIIAGVVFYSGVEQIGIDSDGTDTFSQLVFSVLVYLIGSVVLLIEPYAIRQMTLKMIGQLIGFARRPIVKDLGFGLLAWGAYMFGSVVISLAVSQYIPGVDLDQKQDVGFNALVGQLDIIYAFIAIVIVAPIVEEVVFRGYLYGSLRSKLYPWVAALVVSILFGAVHGQLNVGIDTFLLSLVLCYLRDKTGAIWSGIFVHALKNSLAFYILFLAPPWLTQLLMAS